MTDLTEPAKSKRRGAPREPRTAIEKAVSPPANMLALIDRYVSGPAVDVDKLERMLAFQERLMARQAEIDFNEAKQRVLTSMANINGIDVVLWPPLHALHGIQHRCAG